MPSIQFNPGVPRLLDVRPDRPDLRDRIYQPPLRWLPAAVPDTGDFAALASRYAASGLVLDQGREGACTGFGLAALINYLLFKHQAPPERQGPVSTRMLYHLARIYDEWDGGDYEGSSARGAMKAWFHHGVCTETLWPYRDHTGQPVFVRPTPGWDADAAQRPLGAYYRVTSDAISDMQAAILEVGAVYASARVHAGWGTLLQHETVSTIPWQPGSKPTGGHAFALVGYDRDGFLVQNSWGTGWGFHGFARLGYDDWLANGTDAWVAMPGVPVRGTSPAIILSSRRTVPASAPELGNGLVNGATAEAVVARTTGPFKLPLPEGVEHSLVLGNQGLPEPTFVADENGAATAACVCYDYPRAWLKQSASHRRIVIYVHGGLNSLQAGQDRARVMGHWFAANGIYPLFVNWQSGFLDTIVNILQDHVGELTDRAGGSTLRDMVEGVSDARDYLIEGIARRMLVRAAWLEMKENALAASEGAGGMVLLADRLRDLKGEFPDLAIHLVGHSAGAILLGAFFRHLTAHALVAESLTLFAPACTVEFANARYVPALAAGTIDPQKTFLHILSEQNERKDTVGGVYGKSLLYLVSRALETEHKMPLLGMEASWDHALDDKAIFEPHRVSQDVQPLRTSALAQATRSILQARHVETNVTTSPPRLVAAGHGCFDNSIADVSAVIGRILGCDPGQLPTPVRSLVF